MTTKKIVTRVVGIGSTTYIGAPGEVWLDEIQPVLRMFNGHPGGEIISAGSAGATGPQGPSGAPGATGSLGPTGPMPYPPTAGQGIKITLGASSSYAIDNTGIIDITGTANQISVRNLSGNVTLRLPQDIGINSNPQFGNVTINYLTVTGNITSLNVNNVQVTDNIINLAVGSNSRVQADGGGVYLNGADASLLYSQSDDRWNFNKDLNAANVYAQYLETPFAHVTSNLHVGLTPFIDFPTAPLQITSNENSYQQVNNQNLSSDSQASGDFIVTSNDGDDSNYYIDFGINSSTYNNINYSVGGPHDGYLYVNGGNLTLGTQTHSSIAFHTHGTDSGNVIARFIDNRLVLGGSDNKSSRLQVTGNVSVAGNISVTNNIQVNNSDVVSFATLPKYNIVSTRFINTNSAVISSGDYYVGVNNPYPTALTLPVGILGLTHVVKDESGASSQHSITVIPQLGDSIDGQLNGNAIMNINNMSLTFVYRAGWRII